MNHASLFSGIGGAEVAASMMGWKNLFHCEIQEFPRKVLDYWFPNSESYEDITKTDFQKWQGKIDVLTGGFPCQPFSLAGRRKGADDNRYLWPQMLRAIREIKPTWVVGENVNGIKTMVESCQVTPVGRTSYLFEENYLYREESRFTLDKICADIEDEGYSVQPIIIPACAIGAPHRRDRVWIIAHRSDPGAETMQQGGQDGVLPNGHAAHTDSHRHGERTDKQECIDRSSRETNLSTRRSKRLTSHSLQHRSHEVYQDHQSKFTDGEKYNGIGGERDITLSDFHKKRDFWKNFPTQSPICRGNDGIPFDVDNLTISFPKWRKESIKAYGNAWVPQVAYEIFRAISLEEQLNNCNHTAFVVHVKNLSLNLTT